MPPPRKPTSPARRPPSFKEPAALKRLNKSLDAAQDALAELREDAGRDVSQDARDVYKDLRTFVSNARRDTGKLAKALARDFERAERKLAPRSSSRTTRSGTGSPARTTRSRTTGTRSKSSRASSKRT
jgi:hypothetical protein